MSAPIRYEGPRRQRLRRNFDCAHPLKPELGNEALATLKVVEIKNVLTLWRLLN